MTWLMVYLAIAVVVTSALAVWNYWRFRSARWLSSRGYKARRVYRYQYIKEDPYWVWDDPDKSFGWLLRNAVRRERLVAEREDLNLPPPVETTGQYHLGDFMKDDVVN